MRLEEKRALTWERKRDRSEGKKRERERTTERERERERQGYREKRREREKWQTVESGDGVTSYHHIHHLE
jgi:hypothetical protein